MRMMFGQDSSYKALAGSGSISFWLRRRRDRALFGLVRQERERHTEDVHVFIIEKPRVRIDLVGRAAKAAAPHAAPWR